MTKREEQKEKRRQDILSAGLTLFTSKGYEATKINDIAKEAGMSLGLLYHYFASVEILYEELVNIALLGRTGQYFPQDDSDNPLDYFTKSTEYIFEAIKSDHEYAKYFVLTKQAQNNPNLPVHLKEKMEKNDVIAKSITTIDEGQRREIIREGNPVALTMAFWLSVQAYVEMIALNPELPFPEADWFIDMLRADKNRKNG